MSLKNNINAVKKELSGDEKLFEQAFHLERFYKKNRKLIITTLVLLIGAFIGYKAYSYLENKKLESANSALIILAKDPNNKQALEELKNNNPKLYNLYRYSSAANSGSKEALSVIKTDDSFLQDVISYHIGVLNKTPKDSIYYKNLVLIEKAYNLIKMGKKQEAKNILITIPKTSVLATVAKLLEHYTIK